MPPLSSIRTGLGDPRGRTSVASIGLSGLNGGVAGGEDKADVCDRGATASTASVVGRMLLSSAFSSKDRGNVSMYVRAFGRTGSTVSSPSSSSSPSLTKSICGGGARWVSSVTRDELAMLEAMLVDDCEMKKMSSSSEVGTTSLGRATPCRPSSCMLGIWSMGAFPLYAARKLGLRRSSL